MASLLELRDLTIARRETILIEKVNLTIKAGDIVTITGGNGSGKTTLLETILGLHKAQSGQIFFKSQPIQPRTIAQTIGWVPQKAYFDLSFPITVAEMIQLECKDNSCSTPELHLQMFKATHLLPKKINQLSGGELQKVLIARALMGEPEILILDEPSNNLDKAAQGNLHELLHKLAKQGKAIINITHNHADLLAEKHHYEIVNKRLIPCSHE